MEQPGQNGEWRVLAEFEGDPALPIVRFRRSRCESPCQDVLFDVGWEPNVDSVRFVYVGECLASDPEFEVVLAAVVRLYARHEKHLANY